LQQKGLDVTGIDNSPLAIKVCRLRGLKKPKMMPIEQIGQFTPDSFDAVIMMGNNFGLFGSYKRARILLKSLSRITSPDAMIIAATRNPYLTKDPAHLAYHKLNRNRGRMPGQLKIRVRYQRYVGTWFDYLLVSKTELKEILRDTGWGIRRFIDGKDGQYIMLLAKQ
jgi:hypothetical protein